jgi:hypothetical protein
MKILIATAIAYLFCSSCSGWQMIAADTQKWQFESVEASGVGWFLSQWSCAGYDVPKPFTDFSWSDFLSPVSTAEQPRKFDVVAYLDASGSEAWALVDRVEGDGVWMQTPLPNGIVILTKDCDLSVFIPYEDLIGFLRPHKAEAGK